MCSGYTILPESVKINPTSVSVAFQPPASAANPAPLRLLTNGEPEPNIDEARASEILKEEDLEVVVDLGDGNEEARVWTCDFSHVSEGQARQKRADTTGICHHQRKCKRIVTSCQGLADK